MDKTELFEKAPIHKAVINMAIPTSAFVFYAAIIFGVLMSAAVLLFMEPLLTFIGTDAETHDFVKEYLRWIGLVAPFSIFSSTFSERNAAQTR